VKDCNSCLKELSGGKSSGTLLIADTHFGKEATFRASAIPVPDQTVEQLSRLDRLIHETKCKRLIILGDLIHSRHGRCETVLSLIGDWRDSRKSLKIHLVRGNHDVGAGDPPMQWKIGCIDEPWNDGPFRLLHIPNFGEEFAGPALCGHLHPVVVCMDQEVILPDWPVFC
jgi:uncharacterized protein